MQTYYIYAILLEQLILLSRKQINKHTQEHKIDHEIQLKVEKIL